MDKLEFREYIDSIKDHSKFKKLDEFVKMTQIPIYDDFYESIERYLTVYLYKKSDGILLEPDYDYFKNFMESYLNGGLDKIEYDESGAIDLTKNLYLVQPRFFAGRTGAFFDGWIIMTNGETYMVKEPLNYKSGFSCVRNPYCKYAPLIASEIAKQLGIDTAEYFLANQWNGKRIITPNVLKENEEMLHIDVDDEEVLKNNFISDSLKLIEELLITRRFSPEEIEKTKFEFLKQEFLAKVIGLKDQKPDNSPLIISIDEQGKKHIRMAPMMDYDYSFEIAEEEGIRLTSRRADNGKSDIKSFMEQYKDYPEFKEFVEQAIQKFDMKAVFRKIYEERHMPKFNDYKDEEMLAFIEYADRNMAKAKEAFKEIYKEERGEL